MATVVNHVYRLLRGKKDSVEEVNPLLERGEPIVVFFDDKSTRMKIGDGINRYSDLPFLGKEFVVSKHGILNFPEVGERGVIYIDTLEMKLYVWDLDTESYTNVSGEIEIDLDSQTNLKEDIQTLINNTTAPLQNSIDSINYSIVGITEDMTTLKSTSENMENRVSILEEENNVIENDILKNYNNI